MFWSRPKQIRFSSPASSGIRQESCYTEGGQFHEAVTVKILKHVGPTYMCSHPLLASLTQGKIASAIDLCFFIYLYLIQFDDIRKEKLKSFCIQIQLCPHGKHYSFVPQLGRNFLICTLLQYIASCKYRW